MRNAYVALSMISRAHRTGQCHFSIVLGGYQSRTIRDVVVASSDVLMPSEWRKYR